MPWDCDAFLKNWRDALKEAARQTGFRYDYWQGPIACRELKKLDLLDVVCFSPGKSFSWRLGWALREFGSVVETYQGSAQRLERQRELLTAQVEPLRSAQRSLHEVLTRSIPAKLELSIRNTAKLLKKEISQRTTDIEDRLWNCELMLWRPALHKLIRVSDRDFELDAKFQIRIAFLLLRYLHAAAPQAAKKVKLADISRLVLLFYFVAELAKKDTESSKLRCSRTGKLLSQKIVDQNLTRAGLNRTDFRLSSLARTRGLVSE